MIFRIRSNAHFYPEVHWIYECVLFALLSLFASATLSKNSTIARLLGLAKWCEFLGSTCEYALRTAFVILNYVIASVAAVVFVLSFVDSTTGCS